MNDFLKLYKEKIIFSLKDTFEYKNIMQVPKILKISINSSFNIKDKKLSKQALSDIENISGQKAINTKVKKSISGFGIRAGWTIGYKVTLRKRKMYDFLKKLICIVIPRIQDFRGFDKKSFDNFGNYHLGIKEQIIFPEINYEEIYKIKGFNISIITSAKSTKESIALLESFNFPFKKI